MPRVHTVNKAQKDYPEYDVKKGETYYWWKFRYGGKRVSKTYPKRSQLTQSDFLSRLYTIQDSIGQLSASDPADLQTMVDEIKSELEMLRDEQEERRSNMPDHLQDVGSGELLQQRYDALDTAISEIESLDLDFDDSLLDEYNSEAMEGEEVEDEDNEEYQEWLQQKKQEWVDERIEELQGISIDES